MAERGGSNVVYFLAGLALGAFVGLVVIAPKSGNETREFLSERADEGRDYAQRKARPHGPGGPEPDDEAQF